jgi:hypothetical protein
MGLRAACPKCGDIGDWSLTYCVCKKCDSTCLAVGGGELALQNSMKALNYLIEERESRLASQNMSTTGLREAFERAKSRGVFDEETNAGRSRIDRFCEIIIRQYKCHYPTDEKTQILISKLQDWSDQMPPSSPKPGSLEEEASRPSCPICGAPVRGTPYKYCQITCKKCRVELDLSPFLAGWVPLVSYGVQNVRVLVAWRAKQLKELSFDAAAQDLTKAFAEACYAGLFATEEGGRATGERVIKWSERLQKSDTRLVDYRAYINELVEETRTKKAVATLNPFSDAVPDGRTLTAPKGGSLRWGRRWPKVPAEVPTEVIAAASEEAVAFAETLKQKSRRRPKKPVVLKVVDVDKPRRRFSFEEEA